VSNVSTAGAVCAGGLYACALLTSGDVKCWGGNNEGELADGTQTAENTPQSVKNIGPAVAITCGFRHACALLASGKMWCWGANHSGQLGDGTLLNKLFPVQVQSF